MFSKTERLKSISLSDCEEILSSSWPKIEPKIKGAGNGNKKRGKKMSSVFSNKVYKIAGNLLNDSRELSDYRELSEDLSTVACQKKTQQPKNITSSKQLGLSKLPPIIGKIHSSK